MGCTASYQNSGGPRGAKQTRHAKESSQAASSSSWNSPGNIIFCTATRRDAVGFDMEWCAEEVFTGWLFLSLSPGCKVSTSAGARPIPVVTAFCLFCAGFWLGGQLIETSGCPSIFRARSPCLRHQSVSHQTRNDMMALQQNHSKALLSELAELF